MQGFILLLLPTVALAVYSCPPGGVYNSQYNRCYNYFNTLSRFTFAEQSCVTLGGHLGSISNAFENSLINDNANTIFTDKTITDFWIGANDLVVPGKWAWTDGTNFAYKKFPAGQPQAGNDCASMLMTNGYWQSGDCETKKAYLCVTPPIQSTTCPPPPACPTSACPAVTQCPTGQCDPHCESEWSHFGPTDSCYKAFYDQKWDDAEGVCIEQGGHLTSIHSEVENTFISNLAATRVTETRLDRLTWIGLQLAPNNTWVWSDGTPTDYINWASKQPSDQGTKKCVQIAQDRSHDKWYESWNNEVCNTIMRAFICKKPTIHT